MGREVRRVPKNWEHPKDDTGNYIPLYDGSFRKKAAEWDENARQWNNGLYRFDDKEEGKPRGPDQTGTYEEWAGPRPKEQDYMPNWPGPERTHYQMYEDCTEGTPISPVMETPETLAQWLVDNEASAFGDRKASYEQWLATIKKGWAISAVFNGRTLISGVEDSH